jgi:hypothetical protein
MTDSGFMVDVQALIPRVTTNSAQQTSLLILSFMPIVKVNENLCSSWWERTVCDNPHARAFSTRSGYDRSYAAALALAILFTASSSF